MISVLPISISVLPGYVIKYIQLYSLTDDDPDRYQKMKVDGEEKARSIDTHRLCQYKDFDAPTDLKSTYRGSFRELENYDDL